MKNYKKIILFAFIFLIIIIIGSQAAQALEFKPQIQIPGTDFATKVNLTGDSGTYYIARYVMAIYQYGVSVGAILATVVLMAAGLMWLTSGGSQEKIGQAKNMISGSIIGLVLLFGSYTILNLVNPELVNFHVRNIPNIKEIENWKIGYFWHCHDSPMPYETAKLQYQTPPTDTIGSWDPGFQGYCPNNSLQNPEGKCSHLRNPCKTILNAVCCYRRHSLEDTENLSQCEQCQLINDPVEKIRCIKFFCNGDEDEEEGEFCLDDSDCTEDGYECIDWVCTAN